MACPNARRPNSFASAVVLTFVLSVGCLASCGESANDQSASIPRVNCATFRVDQAVWRALIDNGGDSPTATQRAEEQVRGVVQCRTFTGLSPRAVESKIGVVPDSVNQWGNSRDEPVLFWSDGETGIEVNLDESKTRVVSVDPLTVDPE